MSARHLSSSHELPAAAAPGVRLTCCPLHNYVQSCCAGGAIVGRHISALSTLHAVVVVVGCIVRCARPFWYVRGDVDGAALLPAVRRVP